MGRRFSDSARDPDAEHPNLFRADDIRVERVANHSGFLGGNLEVLKPRIEDGRMRLSLSKCCGGNRPIQEGPKASLGYERLRIFIV